MSDFTEMVRIERFTGDVCGRVNVEVEDRGQDGCKSNQDLHLLPKDEADEERESVTETNDQVGGDGG